MTALVHNLDAHTCYTATSLADCRDDTDGSAYLAACELQDVVTMGKTVVEPWSLGISISIGGVADHGSVVVEMLHGKVTEEKEKTFRITCGEHSCWFPRKALVHVKDRSYYLFAKWFKFNDYQRWFVDKYTSCSGIYAESR